MDSCVELETDAKYYIMCIIQDWVPVFFILCVLCIQIIKIELNQSVKRRFDSWRAGRPIACLKV